MWALKCEKIMCEVLLQDEMASSRLFTYQVLCCIRGYHVYQRIWTPVVGERLSTTRERDRLLVTLIESLEASLGSCKKKLVFLALTSIAARLVIELPNNASLLVNFKHVIS